MSQYFPKQDEHFGGDIYVKVDLSNYAAKIDLKKATGTDTSKLALKSDLASSKMNWWNKYWQIKHCFYWFT